MLNDLLKLYGQVMVARKTFYLQPTDANWSTLMQLKHQLRQLEDAYVVSKE